MRHGLTRKLQDMVFNLLYNEWSSWSMCTRSCKQRRFRTCAMKNWCKNVLLMEEANCYHKGTNCEAVWLASNTLDNEDLDDIDKGMFFWYTCCTNARRFIYNRRDIVLPWCYNNPPFLRGFFLRWTEYRKSSILFQNWQAPLPTGRRRSRTIPIQ